MDERDYHCSVSLRILWRENQNTMIVESQIDFPSPPKTTLNQSLKVTGLAFIGPSACFVFAFKQQFCDFKSQTLIKLKNFQNCCQVKFLSSKIKSRLS